MGVANYIRCDDKSSYNAITWTALFTGIGCVGKVWYIETGKISMELIDRIWWCYKPFGIDVTQLSSLKKVSIIAGAAVSNAKCCYTTSCFIGRITQLHAYGFVVSRCVGTILPSHNNGKYWSRRWWRYRWCCYVG